MKPLALYLALAISFAAAPAVFAQNANDSDWAKYASPPSVESLVTIDGVRIDGSPSLEFDLGVLRLGPFAEFSFHLRHRLETSFDRQTRSVWEIPELRGTIVPSGRDLLRWRRFGANEVPVPSIPPGPGFRQIGNGITMQRSAPGDFAFRDSMGWEWLYRDWVLVSASGPGGLQLVFEVQGGLVTDMRAKRFQIEAGRFSAQYDDGGRILEVRIGAQAHEFGYAPDTGRLVRWNRNGGEPGVATTFEYVDALISRVNNEDGTGRSLRWMELPDGRRVDCKWNNSAGVGRTDRYRLFYTHDVRGYAVSAEPLDGGAGRKIVLNNHKGVVEDSTEGRVARRYRFGVRRSVSDAGKLTTIEDAQGNSLEIYEYDAVGRVARVRLSLGKTIDFTYSPDGSVATAVARDVGME